MQRLWRWHHPRIPMFLFRLRNLLLHLTWSFPDGWRLICCDAHRDCSCWRNDESGRLVHLGGR